MSDVEWAAQEGARALAAGDWDAYGRLFAEDLVMSTPGIPGVARGRDARVDLAKSIYATFPDGRAEPQTAFQQGDWGCMLVRFSGTHGGPMPGPDGNMIPPTGKAIDFMYCMVMRFENGEIAELHELYDQLGLLQQLGIT
jgi:ketosteroid isomerase-like protein